MTRFILALGLGAFLLFVVQPMEARRILPLLGGSPAVWNTSMLCFQALLLGGYAWAHLVATRAAGRRLHAIVLLAPALVAAAPPVAPPAGGADPIVWLLGSLIVSVGLPFFVLATTAPTLQHWFSRSGHRSAADPYFLYGASNVGSLVALIAYPLLIEPGFGPQRQRWLWLAGYALYAALVAWCAGAPQRAMTQPSQPAAAPVPGLRKLHWLALAMLPSSLMLSVTAHLTADVSPFPMLWVIPLAVYLLSFIVAFARTPILEHRWITALHPVVVLPLTVVFSWEAMAGAIGLLFPLHLLAFAVTALLCHGELARTRPPVGQLTEFYLWISIGGALGGVFSAVLAPLAFTSLVEYPLVLAASFALRPGDWSWTKRSGALDIVVPVALALLMAALHLALQNLGDAYRPYQHAMVLGPAAALCLALRARPARLALSVGTILVAGNLSNLQPGVQVLHQARSFFGHHEVQQRPGNYRALLHGRILHGGQYTDQRRTQPLAYYSHRGAFGQAMHTLADRIPQGRVGVVGLGAGTLAHYARPGQHWTFYEIDPEIERTARSFFTYLRDAQGRVDVELGDGRLSIGRARTAEFGLLVLDAFTSDAIPVHLLTREALRIYLDKLAAQGVLMVHITSQFANLEPVLRELARDAGLQALIQEDPPVGYEDWLEHKDAATWVLLARTRAAMGALAVDPRWRPLSDAQPSRLWTDDYADLPAVLRFPWS